MRKSGLIVVTEKRISISYDGIVLPSGLRLDLLVEESVVVEVKAVEKMKELYQSQLLSYLKLTEIRIGLLINFNVRHLRHGIKRMVL
jgi:GxxExxY protein